MPRNRLILVVLIIVLITVVTPLVINRYYLTPSSEQRIIEQVRATEASAKP